MSITILNIIFLGFLVIWICLTFLLLKEVRDFNEYFKQDYGSKKHDNAD